MGSRVPLDLFCEVKVASGATFKWNANEPPSHRLRNLNFSTKIGEGFSLATGTLARRIDQDYPDLQLGMEIVISGADGTIVFEGRLSAMPRELGQTHSISVTFVGHMAHAKDRKFTEIYVDRALAGWGGMSLGRKAALLTSNLMPTDGEQVTDPTDSKAGIATAITGAWASPYLPVAESWYDAGPGLFIGSIIYSWQREGTLVDHTNVAWSWKVSGSDDDKATTLDSTANLRAAGPSALQTHNLSSACRYALLQLLYTSSPAGADSARWAIDWYKLAVYGTSGLATYTGEPGEPNGVYLTDVIRDIAARFCPEFDTSGVEDFEYVVQHCVFKEPTDPYDAFLLLNKYALQHLAVWEGKKLTFRPYDLSDYQWEIRTDDPGTTFAPVGPTIDDLYNAVEVRYTDLLTGTERVVTPDDDASLLDTSDANPWNQWGRYHPLYLDLSGPELEADAIQIGRAALAEKNRPKTAGTLTVEGYIRDRAGNYQPVSRVRAGDVICVTNFNEINRLIVETDYDDESKTLRVAVDFPFQLLEALFDRQANARLAKGVA